MDFRIYNADGEWMASARYAEDAARIVDLFEGGSVRYYPLNLVVWIDGREDQPASESWDHAAEVINQRVINARVAKGR
jgi:hypothetical protein